MNIDLEKMARLNKSGFKQCFFYVCEREDIFQINKMFLKLDIKTRFDSEILSAGLFAGILAEKPKTIDTVLDIALKLNIKLDKLDLTKVFNLLIKKGNYDLLDQLEDKFHVIKNYFKEDGYLSIVNDKFYECGSCGGENSEPSSLDKILGEYYGNVLTKSLNNENHLTYLLNKDFPINPTFTEQLFLDVCVEKNINAAKVLLTHEKTRDIIKKSEDLNGYMQEPTENKEFKDYVRELIKSLEFKEKLDVTLSDKAISKKVKL